jgi:hypothetical protein
MSSSLSPSFCKIGALAYFTPDMETEVSSSLTAYAKEPSSLKAGGGGRVVESWG